ncbi:MAG: ABC transporter permease [Chryseolinea sp.]
MILNYFKIAYRHLIRSKAFSLINIFGLAVGITAFFLIVQFTSFETNYDKFHINHDAIYRVGLERYTNGELQQTSAKTFAGIRSLLKQHFAEVTSFTGFYKTPANTGFLFRSNGKLYNEPGGVLNPDSSFFKVFPSLLVRGDAATVLKNKNNLVISESMAHKLFGDTDPIGQTIERIDDDNNGSDFVVTGILKDIPANSHFHASFIRHIEDSWPIPDYWKESFLFTYINISDGSDPHQIANRMNVLLRKLEKDNPLVKGSNVFLQPITDIHLSSHFKDELEANGSKTLLYSLTLIGLVILGMAWINYVNLQTARFTTRAKEVGVRRIIGSGKSDLAVQFLIEYFFITIASLLVAVFLLFFILPYFSELTGIPLISIEWSRPEVWIIALCVFTTGSIIVGVYPALFLLKLNPLTSLKGYASGRIHGSLARRSLVVIQFSASLVLIAFVMVINAQLDFMRISSKKIELEHVIAIANPTAYSNQELQSTHNEYKVFENKLLQNAAVKIVASSSAIPGSEIGFSYINLIKRNQDDPYDPTIYKTLFVDCNYIPAYGLKLLAGQNFAGPETGRPWIDPWQDKSWTTIVLNERAIRQLGFHSPEEAIGQMVNFQLFDEFLKYKIIGVVEDYHHEAVKKEVYPTIFALNYSAFQQVYYSVRLNARSNSVDALAYIEKSWKELFPERPFEYFFLDDYYDQQYKSELHFGSTFTLFAGIAVFIACLGILGMTLFETNARLKEISIRKALGASAVSLVTLLFRDHARIVLMSTLIAGPLIYFFGKEWLSTYPNRIEISFLFFFAPLGIILSMVVVTSGFQTVKAANTNPVDHLKHE